MLSNWNLDLYLFGVAAAASVLLGATVFFQNRKSATNRLFLFFTISSAGWSAFNYLSYKVFDPLFVLWVVRLVMFFAVYQAFTFFLLMFTFPNKNVNINSKKLILISAVVLLTSLLTLTPLVFSKVEILPGQAPTPVAAPGIMLFAIVAISLVIGGIITLVRKILHASKNEKKPLRLLAAGVGLMFLLIIIFNFIFVAVLKNSSFIPISSIFIFPFVVLTSYAIIKHELMNVRIVAAEMLTFALVILSFVEIVISRSFAESVFRGVIFIALLIFGIAFIKATTRETEQREKLEDLTNKLKNLDKQKDEFISMAAHELRAPMTAIKGYITMVLEGDTGDIPEKARGFLAETNTINERLIRLVNNMLNVSRIEEGRMVYQMEVENLSRPVSSVFSQFAPEAERKGLEYKLEIPNEIRDKVEVDGDRVQEVIGNFLSNAVKYTDKGFVKVRLSQPTKDTIRCEVIDSGSGISPDEQGKLFQKFHRVESNVGKTTGTGLGLYICKLLVEKFNGKLGVISEAGKGSTFWFELPLTKETVTVEATKTE